MFILVTETKLLEFISESLKFCSGRMDTYAELVKDSATNLLVVVSASESSQYAYSLCELSLSLIEILGELIQDERQSAPVRYNICLILGNIAAEQGGTYKQIVVKRAKVMGLLDLVADGSTDAKLEDEMPWLINNLYCEGIRQVLD